MKQAMRHLGRAALAVAVLTLVAGTAMAAQKEPEPPSYAIPNLIAIVMCAAAFLIPCKLFRRS